jgi:ketosteroid isomerase-like protein
MRRSLAVLGLPFLLVSPAAGAALRVPTGASFTTLMEGGGAEAGEDETRRALTDLKAQVVKAFVDKDKAALDRIYADDYVATDSKGAMRTKRDEIARVDGGGGDTLVSGRYDVVSVRVYGDVAVMSGHGHLTWRRADGTSRNSDYYSFNVFERRGSQWKYVAAFLP